MNVQCITFKFLEQAYKQQNKSIGLLNFSIAQKVLIAENKP